VSSASTPASSANLGPGYDVLALALDLRCRVEVSQADEWSILSGGAPADPSGVSLVVRTVEAATPGVGPLRVTIESEIPLARGLGSSAALIVATAGAVRSMEGGSVDPLDLLPVAAEVEGHPDNVAAALFGGLVAATANGGVRRLEVHPSIRVLVAVPESTLSTDEARKATSKKVSTSVASRTASRLGFLIEGMRTGDPDVLADAAGDELHEARRAHLSPITGRLIEAATSAGAHHACWSGAGPSALALVTDATSEAVRDAFCEALDGGYVLSPDLDHRGLLVG
jgi:homoserine kinase